MNFMDYIERQNELFSEVNSSSQTFSIYEKKWHNVKLELKNDFKSIIWNSWIGPLKVLKYTDYVLNIIVKTELVKNRIERQYYEQVLVKAKIFFPELREIKFIVNTDLKNKAELENDIKTTNKLKDRFSDDQDSKTGISFITSVSKTLNKNFTFEKFVIGESNDLAFFSSKKVSQDYSSSYNPLFIYGGVGLGKTHLLNAIAWEICKEKKRKFAYMSAERFMYQFIRALKLKENIKFKEQFRSIDVLMIDDLQFIGGKESTQQEFFHLFNDLIELNKQIIITADKSPGQITEIDDRLKSRLSGGLVVDVLPTNNDLRVKIINNKLLLKKNYVDKEIVHFLAENITNNIRELEGALNKIIAYSDFMKSNLNLEKVKEILADLLRSNFKKISISDVQLHVSRYFNLSFSDLCSKKRSRFISRPRQIAMYLSKEYTELSYPEIGKSFGGKDHATVIHAVNKVKNLCFSDKKIKKDVEILIATLKS